MRIAVFLTAILLFVSRTHADAPLPAPAPTTIHSPQGTYTARLDPEDGITVYPSSPENAAPLWVATGWSSVGALSDDGRSLVLGYVGMNLIPRNYDLDMTMLTFFQDGEVIRTVALSELVDSELLERNKTLSHYHWGNFTGIVEDGHYQVETADGQKIHFDITTGTRVDH